MKNVGQVTVRGVITTDYQALVTSPLTDGDGIAVDTFVGDDGLVHRYTLAGVFGASGSPIASPTSSSLLTSVRLSIDFYDFGTAGDVVAPTDVTDNPVISGGPTGFPIPSIISDSSPHLHRRTCEHDGAESCAYRQSTALRDATTTISADVRTFGAAASEIL